MPQSLSDGLAALLAHTQALLACAEPSLADWEDYGRRRNELFQRLQEAPAPNANSDSNATALAQLCAALLENDRILVSKIRHHLSETSQEIAALAGQRRIFSAYLTGAAVSHTYHRHTV